MNMTDHWKRLGSLQKKIEQERKWECETSERCSCHDFTFTVRSFDEMKQFGAVHWLKMYSLKFVTHKNVHVRISKILQKYIVEYLLSKTEMAKAARAIRKRKPLLFKSFTFERVSFFCLHLKGFQNIFFKTRRSWRGVVQFERAVLEYAGDKYVCGQKLAYCGYDILFVASSTFRRGGLYWVR